MFLGMLDEFVVVTITRPGPLHLRLRPDTRGLVVLNNFDILSEDPHTSCPRLGPVEGVGTVMPGDALVGFWVSRMLHDETVVCHASDVGHYKQSVLFFLSCLGWGGF